MGGFLDSMSATVMVVGVGMVLTLSLERSPPRAAQNNLPVVSPLGTGLGRGFTACLTDSLLLPSPVWTGSGRAGWGFGSRS